MSINYVMSLRIFWSTPSKRQVLMDVLVEVLMNPASTEGNHLDIRVKPFVSTGEVQITFPVPLAALKLSTAEALTLCTVVRGACNHIRDARDTTLH